MDKTPSKKQNLYCQLLKSYLFLMWDGLGFFGFDDNKLDRLKGRPPKWYDRFYNKRWIAAKIITLSFVLYIFIS